MTRCAQQDTRLAQGGTGFAQDGTLKRLIVSRAPRRAQSAPRLGVTTSLGISGDRSRPARKHRAHGAARRVVARATECRSGAGIVQRLRVLGRFAERKLLRSALFVAVLLAVPG